MANCIDGSRYRQQQATIYGTGKSSKYRSANPNHKTAGKQQQASRRWGHTQISPQNIQKASRQQHTRADNKIAK
jgi:hypothetical protein